jgi:hypothetical protein
MAHGGGSTAARGVTIGLALSILPILLRVLPPLAMKTQTEDGLAYSWVTAVGLVVYVVAVAVTVVLIDR